MIVYFIAYCPLIGYSGIGIKAKCDSDRAILSLLSLLRMRWLSRISYARWQIGDCGRT